MDLNKHKFLMFQILKDIYSDIELALNLFMKVLIIAILENSGYLL